MGVDIIYQDALYKHVIYFVLKNGLPHSGLQGLSQAQQKQVLTKASGPQ